MRIATAVLALATLSSIAGAQASNHAVVRVQARDSSGAPIAGAEITVVRNIKDVVAKTTTDEQGRAYATVELKDSSDFELTMRKIGYRRGDRFFEVGPRDTTLVNIVVPVPSANQIAAMTVTAKRNPNRFNTYDLDADEIETSDRVMVTGWDVVKALRPVMLTSRGGCATGALQVWVNGKWIRLPLPPTGMARAQAFVGAPPNTRVSYVPISVLSEIAPEHIAEIHYKDCFDHSMAVVGTNDAIFVTLKPGVTYVENVGSFVITEAEEQKARR